MSGCEGGEDGSLKAGGKIRFGAEIQHYKGVALTCFSPRDDSENERAYRSWKKPIMILWNDIAAHKFASLFLRPITDDQAPGYHSIVYR